MPSKWAVGVLAAAAFMAAVAGPSGQPRPAASPSTPSGHRVATTVNRGWTFNYFPAADAGALGAEAPAFDDSTWPEVAVPHTWQTYETTGKVHPFVHDAAESDDPYWWRGWGWYRKHFSLARHLAGRKVFLEFDGVQKYCRVFVNGRLAADHKGGYDGFDADITGLVRFDGDNVIAVAVNNRQNDTFSIPPMSAGNFDVYGGIYRDVRIVVKDRLYIPYQGSARHEGGTFVTTPAVTADAGVARVRTWVQNDGPDRRACELRTTILDPDGRRVQQMTAARTVAPGELAEFDQQSAPVNRPRLWSPETPSVYTVVSEVVERGTVVDRVESPLGFRSFHWDYDANRLILNGKKVIVHGSNRHQEYPWLGDATPKWLHLLDMEDMRDGLNHNFMRTAHYPHDPAIYGFTDRRGIIVIEEVPNIKRQKFSDEVQLQQLREMIRRDRNHPSIFFWSMGNETDHAVDSKYAVEEDATRIIHARDVYNDSAGKLVGTTSANLALESLLRCTIRGWYDADVRNLEPESAQQTGHEVWQHDMNAREIVARNAGRMPADRANINTWLYEDHGCDREYANAPLKHVNPKGFVDAWRTPKYFYYLWQANYAERLMVFVQPHYWRSTYLGRRKEIVVDSNAETVELKVNGRSLGVRTPRFEDAYVVRFPEVPVERGVLTAEARRGREVAVSTVVMAGPAARLTLAARPAALEAGLDSVAVVRADIVDAGGHHVYGATNTLHWTVSGPATLVGPPVYATDTAKNEEMSGTMYIDAPAFNVIRSTGAAGRIVVRVQSPGLASAQVEIAAALPLRASDPSVVEPAVPTGPRRPVARPAGPAAVAAAPVEMKAVAEDLSFDPAGGDAARGAVDAFLRSRNPALDFAGPEYRAVVAVVARLAENGRGTVIRDDFNFTARRYDECRRITRALAGLDVPAPFARALREHYALAMIEQGEALSSDAEVRRFAALPGGTVVVTADAGRSDDPRVLHAGGSDFTTMVRAAVPGFDRLGADRQAAVLDETARLNPWVRRAVVRSGGERVEGVRQKVVETVTFEVPSGRPVLVRPVAR